MKTFLFYRIFPILLPFLILGAMRFSAIPDGCENSTDGYWHVYAADRPLAEMTGKTFPITLSVWRDHFADKEFLFHMLLKGYTGIRHLAGQSLRPPFTGASLLLLAILLSGFVFACARAGIPDKAIVLYSTALALFSPLFTYRILMVRPHVVSIALNMVACGILLRGPGRLRTAAALFGMGWLFAWSYSTPHVLIVTAIGFAAAWFPRDGFRAILPVVSSSFGIFCGLLVHPQSPNTFTLWKIQGIDALLVPTAGLGHGVIPLAKELVPPSTFWIVVMIPLLILLYLCLMMWNRLREQNGWLGIPPECTALCLLAFVWFGAACTISYRPIEYAVPFLFLAFGRLLPEVIGENSFRYSGKPAVLYGLLTSYLLAGAVCSGIHSWHTMRRAESAPFQLAETLKTLAKPGDRVVNIDWSDFPPLVFLAPEFEYTWGLDPMFSFTPFPEKSKVLGKLSGPGVFTSWKLRKEFQSDYAVLLNKRRFAGVNLQKNCGWETVYDGPDGWIFRLSGSE